MKTELAICAIFILLLGLVLYVKPPPEVKIVEKPVIVTEVRIERVPMQVVVKEVQIEKIPTPVVVKELQIEKVPTPVVIEKTVERVVEKPVGKDLPTSEAAPITPSSNRELKSRQPGEHRTAASRSRSDCPDDRPPSRHPTGRTKGHNPSFKTDLF
jgi:hypothetical protein